MGNRNVKRTCEICGQGFLAYRVFVNKGLSRFCSVKCRNASRAKSIPVNCAICKTEFYATPNDIDKKHRLYCSNKCRSLGKRSRTIIECKVCQKEFEIQNSNVGKIKYCSKACRKIGMTKEVTCECPTCHKNFVVWPSDIKFGRKYCSVACSTFANTGPLNPLWKGGRQRYRGENWTQQRKLAYQRDSGICQHCGIAKNKNGSENAVHHIRPYRQFNGDYVAANDLLNLITLCSSCHKLAEYGKIPLQPKLF